MDLDTYSLDAFTADIEQARHELETALYEDDPPPDQITKLMSVWQDRVLALAQARMALYTPVPWKDLPLEVRVTAFEDAGGHAFSERWACRFTSL